MKTAAVPQISSSRDEYSLSVERMGKRAEGSANTETPPSRFPSPQQLLHSPLSTSTGRGGSTTGAGITSNEETPPSDRMSPPSCDVAPRPHSMPPSSRGGEVPTHTRTLHPPVLVLSSASVATPAVPLAAPLLALMREATRDLEESGRRAVESAEEEAWSAIARAEARRRPHVGLARRFFARIDVVEAESKGRLRIEQAHQHFWQTLFFTIQRWAARAGEKEKPLLRRGAWDESHERPISQGALWSEKTLDSLSTVDWADRRDEAHLYRPRVLPLSQVVADMACTGAPLRPWCSPPPL